MADNFKEALITPTPGLTPSLARKRPRAKKQPKKGLVFKGFLKRLSRFLRGCATP